MASPLHFLITAGPTREAIDPVRFLSNRSSGRMGFALAQAAAEAGHAVWLVAGPVALETPAGVRRIDVESAEEMWEAVRPLAPAAHVVVMAAAVADYRPACILPHKLKKSAPALQIDLVRTRDLLASLRAEADFAGVLVGFAAETGQLVENAREKLLRKGCDLIVANDVSRPGIGFDSPDNEVVLLHPDGRARHLPRASKLEIARELVRVCASLHQERNPAH